MENPPTLWQSWVVGGVVLLGVAACLAVWGCVVRRLVQGRPVLDFQPWRRVPWVGADVLLVFLFYVTAMGAIPLTLLRAFSHFASPPAASRHVEFAKSPPNQPPANELNAERNEHPVVRLLRESRGAGTLLLTVVAVVVTAPIGEEFFFRLLLLGWLGSAERRLRRRWPVLRATMAGLGPILLASALFAGLHLRTGKPDNNLAVLFYGLLGSAVTNVLAVLAGTSLIRLRTGATWTDFGLVPGRFWSDVGLGLAVFVAVAPPIYLLQGLLVTRLPSGLADPISLFFFAVALGTLYYRTQRIVPAVVVHMALNASSVAIFLLAS
jgi:membrane protease YdiL (CAAX protease family)